MRRALSFLTPLGVASAPDSKTLRWFPAVGLAIGVAVGGVWWVTARVWPVAVAAAIAVAADLALTGMLHFDGLVDFADGMLPPLERQRRMDVMAEPGVGAFGVITAATCFLLRWVSLSAIHPSVLLVGGLWCASRTWMVATMDLVPYARREGGLAAAFLSSSGGSGATGPFSARPARGARMTVAVGLALALAGLMGWKLLAGGVVLVSAAIATAGVVLLARRRIGGFTGDVLGAAGIVGETVGLVVAAASW